MLGFATVDVSKRDNTLTVWLTSLEGATNVRHTNAVTFDLSDDTVSRRAVGMMCDRYVVLTERAQHERPLLTGWGVKPCDLAMLAKLTTAAQATVMAAFEEYRTRPGKAGLTEPNLLPVPEPLDQAALDADTVQLTLALANQVMRTWRAWLITERERIMRWKYMPGGHKGEARALLPAEFVQHNTVQPIRPLPV